MLLFDKRWKMYLLPYHRTPIDIQQERQRQISFITDNLGIDEKNVEVDFKKQVQTEKHSLSDDLSKTYIHRFSEVKIHITNNKLSKKAFWFKGRHYRWYSIDEMKNNKKMQEHNKDVIEILSELYG